MMWTLKLTIALVISAVLTASHYQAWKSGKSSVQQQWDAAITLQAQATVKLVLDAQAKEKILTTKVNLVGTNYEKAKLVNAALVTGLTSSLRDLKAELDKRDAADTQSPSSNHGPTPERLVCRSALENLQALAGIADEHREQIIALQAYINSVK